MYDFEYKWTLVVVMIGSTFLNPHVVLEFLFSTAESDDVGISLFS